MVDEAGMLDQDGARALLALADAGGAQVALIGDRHQLPAVGRGGVLDLATRYAADRGMAWEEERMALAEAALEALIAPGREPTTVTDLLPQPKRRRRTA